MSDPSDVLTKVRRALGRTGPLPAPPEPPPINEAISRLVRSDQSLAELFTARATASKMYVESVGSAALPEKLVAFFHKNNSRRVALSDSPLLEKLGVAAALRQAGLEPHSWSSLSLDQLYDMDGAVTDVFAAVAETGSLVVRSTPQHGRALSLVPPVHAALVEPGNLLPDLIDLFELLSKQSNRSGLTIISGPSKTADIELNLVTGVHGPGVVKAFLVG